MYADSFDEQEYGWDATVVNPFDPSGRRGYYSHAIVTVRFKSVPYATDGNMAYISESTEPSVRRIAAPAAVLATGGGAHPTADSGMDCHGIDYVLELHQVPVLNVNAYRALAGCTNQNVFFGNPTGTVLFPGMSTSQSTVIGSTTTYQIRLPFQLSRINWNAEFAGTGITDVLYGGVYRYPPADFSTFFSS